MTSRERMRAALCGELPDHVPCSFMLFHALYQQCKSEREFVERQLEMGLDAVVHVGHLNPELHRGGGLAPDARMSEWVEEREGRRIFCRRIDTPNGPLMSRVREHGGWPTREDFPIFNDWLVPRTEEILVKPERDLEKLRYLFGPIRDRDIETLKEEAAEAGRLAGRYGLLQVGGWKGAVRPGLLVDPGIMGADAMAWLSGFEAVMLLSMDRPEIAREYLRIIHEWNMKQLQVYLEVTQAELIVRRGWYETTEFWTPDAYRTIIAPFLKNEVDLVHAAGRTMGYIITSAFGPILDAILDTGIDVLIGIDPLQGKGTPIGAVKQRFVRAGRALWGGVSGALTVEQGTEEEVDESVRSALEVLAPGGGFILSPVDNVSATTEAARRNSDRFIRAWKRYRG